MTFLLSSGRRTRIFLGALLCAWGFGVAANAQEATAPPKPAVMEHTSFEQWLDDFKAEARAKGISSETLASAFQDVTPLARVLELDQRQPEFTLTLGRYLKSAITEQRVDQGRKLLAKHGGLLQEVSRKYGVQPRFLVAFWGLESNYGDFTGGFSVIAALATLAHDTRRSDFFRRELHHALRIIEDGHIRAESMSGSWAGAMGQLQFMPSTFTGYAIDGNADGKNDIWHSLPDIFASAAHYLQAVGWRGDETWGREVKLPDGFDWDLAELGTQKSLGEWQALGVRRANGGDLPTVDIQGSVVLPAGHRGPAFLVYKNFRTTMIWNRSTLYAIAVGHLADRLAGKGPLVAKPAVEESPLRRSDIELLQVRLAALGFDPGEADGRAGPKTRKALKAFQRSRGLPADGYPTREILGLVLRS